MQFGPSPQAQEYGRSSPVVYLQLNGEIAMLENPEKKIVNCSAKYLQDTKRIL